MSVSLAIMSDHVLALSEQAMEWVGDMPSVMYFTAAGCMVVPPVLLLLRKCFGGQRDKECILPNIHFYAGAPVESNYTQRCIDLLKNNPEAVNKALPERQYFSHGYTPFLRACWNNNFELIHFMLQIGANITYTNSDGESALYLVAYRVSKSKVWDPRALNLLWSSGCSVDDVNVHNNSMLHLAAKAGNSTLTRWLLLHGADSEVLNDAGYSPRLLALKKGSPAHLAVAELLHTSRDNVRRVCVLRSDGILMTCLQRSSSERCCEEQ